MPRWLIVVKKMVCGHVGLVIGPRQLRTTPHCPPSFLNLTLPEKFVNLQRRGTVRGGHASTACLLNTMLFAMLTELLKAIFFHPLFQAQWQCISSFVGPDDFTGRCYSSSRHINRYGVHIHLSGLCCHLVTCTERCQSHQHKLQHFGFDCFCNRLFGSAYHH